MFLLETGERHFGIGFQYLFESLVCLIPQVTRSHEHICSINIYVLIKTAALNLSRIFTFAWNHKI